MTNRPGNWIELDGEGTRLALHEGGTGIALTLESSEPLEQVAGRLKALGYELETMIVDEAFGRSLTVRDPDGLEIQIAENDRELY